MKRILFSLLALLLTGLAASAQSPSSSKNYIMETVVKHQGHKSVSSLSGLPVDSANRKISYFDGLGRPVQTIQWKGSPTQKDLIQFMLYDSLGREEIKYLPYADSVGNDASYKSSPLTKQAHFYGASGSWDANVAKTPYPYSRTIFEPSPINRVLEQGAPGAVWQPYAVGIGSSGHTVKQENAFNGSGEVDFWAVSGSGAYMNGTYTANTLYKTISKDENWSSGKAGTVAEFKDMQGRVVLKRQWLLDTDSLSTFYVYDDYGNLRYVVPPAVTGNFEESYPAFKNYVYGYHYDGEKRLIEKKIPGKGWEYIVYNKLDQVILTQDSVLRSVNQWLFTKYDQLGRTIITGVISSSSTRATWQTNINAQSVLWEDRVSDGGLDYSNNTLPVTDYIRANIANYYDDYDFRGMGSSFPPVSTVSLKTRGMLTGTRIWHDNGLDSEWSIHYYDEDGRLKENIAENHLGGTDRTINTYNFAGELATSTRTHIANSTTTTIANSFTYDHAGRKISTKENINSQGEVVLNKLEYNEIGQLKKKNLHSTDDGATFMQSTKFAYNERGWMKGSTSNEFSMKLGYDTLSNPQYNGNISTQLWGSSYANQFDYSYDKLNRLANGTTSKGIGMGEVLTYDNMGNILTLNRDGTGNMNYSYSGNQLTGIGGALSSYTYTYDGNGNATYDGLRAMTLVYNHLNLPVSATKTGTALAYTYDANGQKLRKVDSSTSTTTDYVGGIQYTNGTVEFIQTEEGRALNNSGTYSYQYNLTDHLGNVRYSFDIYSGAIRKLQEDNYYAFGLRHSATGGTNNYLYNGKELQEEMATAYVGGEYDYGARFYDPVIGRWNVVDPMAEAMRRYSPYNYVFNNPLRFVDPDGMGPTDWVNIGNRFLWDDRVTDQKTAEKLHGDKATYIGKEATVTARKDGLLGAPVSLHSDGTISQLGETLSVNSDKTFTDANSFEFVPKQTNGRFVGLSAGASVIGGVGVSAGVVKDAIGETSPYFTISGDMGIGGGFEIQSGAIKPTGKNQFLTSDYGGHGSSNNIGISTPIVDVGISDGGSTLGGQELNRANFGSNNRGYRTIQGGFSAGSGLGISLVNSTTTTWVAH